MIDGIDGSVEAVAPKIGKQWQFRFYRRKSCHPVDSVTVTVRLMIQSYMRLS